MPAEVGVAFFCGLVLAFLGPYHTSAAPVASRLIYWVGLSIAWIAVSQGVDLALTGFLRFRALQRWQRLLLTVVLGSVPMGLLVAQATNRLVNVQFGITGLPLLYTQVALISAGVSFAVWILTEHTARQSSRASLAHGVSGHPLIEPPGEIVPSALPAQDRVLLDPQPRDKMMPGERILSRLPPPQRGRLRCLAGEDHYVRVYTDRGSTLLLMRFRDALEEVNDLPGERVHRSWWVARSEPSIFRRNGRTAFLDLPGELAVPVSIPYLGAAKALSSS